MGVHFGANLASLVHIIKIAPSKSLFLELKACSLAGLGVCITLSASKESYTEGILALLVSRNGTQKPKELLHISLTRKFTENCILSLNKM